MQNAIDRTGTLSLLGQVLGLTSAAFVVTGAAGWLGRGLPVGAALLIMLLSFPIIIAMAFQRENEPVALTLFYGLAACMGAGLGPVLAQYAHTGQTNVVFEAAGLTALGIAVLGIVAWSASLDYRRLESFGLAGLGILIVGSLLAMFVHAYNPTIYAWLTLAVFAIIVPADFARIKAGGDGETPIELAVAIYLDALNVFLAILQILGKKDDD